MLLIVAISTGAAASVPTVKVPSVDPAPSIVIRNNLGGMIGDFLLLKKFLEKYNVKVTFDGPCISACTMLLRLPQKNICVTQSASFWFHRASHPDPEVAEKASVALLEFYPDWVRKYITDHGGLTKDFIIMKYADVKPHMPTCR